MLNVFLKQPLFYEGLFYFAQAPRRWNKNDTRAIK